MALCKPVYVRTASEDQEKRLQSLVDFLDENGIGFYRLAERVEGDKKFVEVTVDIKVSANRNP